MLKRNGLLTVIAAVVLMATVAQAQFTQDDVAFGLDSTFDCVQDSGNSGSLMTDSYTNKAAQSMEFDNEGGILHNAGGNLLGMAYSGGNIYTYETDLSTGGTQIGSINTNGGGLSVSPDNSKVACTDYSGTNLNVGDYVADTSVDNWTKVSGAVNSYDTQGTTWLDNDNVLVAATSSGSNVTLKNYKVSTDTLTKVASGLGNDYTGFSDVEYNPEIAPYVYVMTSNYYSGTTTNILDVLDPTDWSIVASVDYSSSMATAREIALDSEGNLLVGQFGSAIDIITDADIPTGLSDDASTDYYSSNTFASYNGMDVASNVPEPATLALLLFGVVPAAIRRIK